MSSERRKGKSWPSPSFLPRLDGNGEEEGEEEERTAVIVMVMGGGEGGKAFWDALLKVFGCPSNKVAPFEKREGEREMDR